MSNPASSLKIGLALGSGASRGWSHIGVINALSAAGVEPDIVCGTSVGAIVGGSYVAGNLDKLTQWVLASTRTDVLRFFNIGFSQSGFVDIERLRWFLRSFVAAEDVRIEELQKKFVAVSTNLETGREVWFTEGGMAHAVRASMAMPGLFPPVRDARRWLVDGGLVNPVPVTACRALGADVVIGVNLNSDIVDKRKIRSSDTEQQDDSGVIGKIKRQAKEYTSSIRTGETEKEPPPNLFYAVTTSINIFQDRITRSRLAGDPADVLISPRVDDIGILEFHRAAEAIKEGEDCVRKSLAKISRLTGTTQV